MSNETIKQTQDKIEKILHGNGINMSNGGTYYFLLSMKEILYLAAEDWQLSQSAKDHYKSLAAACDTVESLSMFISE